MTKPRVRIERLSNDQHGNVHVVKEYGPRNCCAAELFRGDIAECQDFAQEYVHDLREMAAGR